MKHLISFIFIFSNLLCFLYAGSEDVKSSAEDACSYAKKGVNADTLEDIQYYAKKAMSAAEDAQSEADDCNLDEAASHAEEAYLFAKKAYRSDDFEEAIDFLRKAKSAADDAISACE